MKSTSLLVFKKRLRTIVAVTQSRINDENNKLYQYNIRCNKNKYKQLQRQTHVSILGKI